MGKTKGKQQISRSERIRRFAAAYLRRPHAIEAAKEAGYTGSRGVLAVRGSELLRDPEVRAIMDAAHAEQHATAAEVLATMAGIMRSTPEDWLEIDENGEPRIDLGKAKRLEALGAIKKVKITKREMYAEGETVGEETKIEVEGYDRLAAAHHLAKTMGLFIDRREVKHQVETQADPDQIIAKLLDAGVPIECWDRLAPGLRRHYEGSRKRVASTEVAGSGRDLQSARPAGSK